MTAGDIARLIPTIQAASLATHNLKAIDKKMDTKDMLKLGTENIVGTNMIRLTAGQASLIA